MVDEYDYVSAARKVFGPFSKEAYGVLQGAKIDQYSEALKKIANAGVDTHANELRRIAAEALSKIPKGGINKGDR